MKCITLEYPNGTVAIRGGIGPVMLARTILAARNKVPVDQVSQLSARMARKLLDEASVTETEQARDLILRYILETLVPQQNPGCVARIEDIAIPADRDFRDAWTRGNKNIEVDMPKAREIHRDRLRAARAPKLAELDIEHHRADEQLDAAEKAAIATRKQELRDVTNHPDIELAETPEDLKTVWPELLT